MSRISLLLHDIKGNWSVNNNDTYECSVIQLACIPAFTLAFDVSLIAKV